MRPLFFLIVLGAIGYLGWTYYEGKLPLPQTRLPEDSAPAAESSDPPARSASPLPVFQSRIKTGTAVIEGDKKMAPPRVFYMAGREFEREEVIRLLEEKKVGPLEGFRSKLGRSFAAVVSLGEDWKPKFDFENNGTEASGQSFAPTNPEPLGDCPVCKNGKVFETAMGCCDDKNRCNEEGEEIANKHN